MDQARAITANFAINTYTITPSAGANGSINPAIPVVVPTIPNYTALLADTSLQIPGAIAYVNSILDDPNTPADTWGLYIFIVVDSFNYMSADPPVPPDEFYIAGDVSGRAIRGGGPVQQQGEWQLINSGTP